MPGHPYDVDTLIGQIVVCRWKTDHLPPVYGYVLGDSLQDRLMHTAYRGPTAPSWDIGSEEYPTVSYVL